MPNIHHMTAFCPTGVQPRFTAGSKTAPRYGPDTHNRGRLRRMEEFLASILARFAFLVVEALIARLVRAFMPAPASPAQA